MVLSRGMSASEALLPPPALLRHAHDPRKSGPGWVPAARPAAAAAALAALGVSAPARSWSTAKEPEACAAPLLQDASVPPALRSETQHPRPALMLPRRELNVEATVEVLRQLRRQNGLFADLSLADLDDLAAIGSALRFERSESVFCRGELASWFGVLLTGELVAVLPDVDGSEHVLGKHRPGEMLGLSRTALCERSHVRAFTLRGTAPGFVAVWSFDQLEGMRRTQPSLHCALLRALLVEFADAAAGFFRGCPLSCGVQWPIIDFHERRVLDMLLELREKGKLFVDVDYRALLALACRLRVTQWEARSGVLSRGAPLTAALIVLNGKLTGFREAGGPPCVWFEPGDAVGLEGILGGVRPCSFDIFAARPTLAALLFPSDIDDLSREFPSLASQVVQSLYIRMLNMLAEPYGRSLLLIADGSQRVRYPAGEVPALPSAPSPWPPGLTPETAKASLNLAETTAPAFWHGVHGAANLAPGLAAADDAALHELLGGPPGIVGEPAADWALGSFLYRKCVQTDPDGTAYTPAARSPHKHKATGEPCFRRQRERPLSEPPAISRFHPDLLGDERKPRRVRAGLSESDLVKAAAGLDVTRSEIDPSLPMAPYSVALRRAYSTSRGTARSALGAGASASMQNGGHEPDADAEDGATRPPPWRPWGSRNNRCGRNYGGDCARGTAMHRTRSEPPLLWANDGSAPTDHWPSAVRDLLRWRCDRGNGLLGDLASDNAAGRSLSATRGSGLHHRASAGARGAGVCPQCGASVQLRACGATASASVLDGGGGGSAGVLVRVVSAGRDHGDRADFYLGGRRITMPAVRRRGGRLRSDGGAGVHVVALEPCGSRVASAWLYDTSAASPDAVAASAQLAADLHSLPEGCAVLVAVKGSGLEGLSPAALAALELVGATPARVGSAQPRAGYALIGCRGGPAIAERQSWSVEIEGLVRTVPTAAQEALSQPFMHAASAGPAAAKDADLQWYFEQQRRFLFDLRSKSINPEESVAADQQQAWNVQIVAQQEEIARLQAQVKELEGRNASAQRELSIAVRERDEWKSSAMRMQLNREFKSTIENLEADNRRFLRPACTGSMTDFGRALQQQLDLAKTPLQLLSSDGVVHHQAEEHQPPPALRTFPRVDGLPGHGIL
eukprot:TRINITY_DN28926_c1_g1_i1.p1 TRINITY_DN28926_c1_g1~~TRINITY_DN28926_c1_g1_i1.p1  ORF type:complete len:1137 (-),score=186.57 TRINITY_DN28926_c1_g1_i1:242-3652(-)